MNIFFMGRDEKEINWSTLQWKKKDRAEFRTNIIGSWKEGSVNKVLAK